MYKTPSFCKYLYFMKIKSIVNLQKKICAKKKIICAIEKKSASMKILMTVLGLYVCLLFRITVNNAELGIHTRTSPKTIRSQKILLHHNMSIQSKRD